VIKKAYGNEHVQKKRFDQDTTGYSFDEFERYFLAEKGLAAPMDTVKRIQQEVETLFYSLKSKRIRETNEKATALNKVLTSSYAFQIRTPFPTWHNCDHELPEGLYQLMVAKPGTAPTYMYSQQEKTLDYFPAGRSASAVFRSPVKLDILSFGVVDDGLKLATGSTKASRSQTDTFGITYEDATLAEIEQALISLDDV